MPGQVSIASRETSAPRVFSDIRPRTFVRGRFVYREAAVVYPDPMKTFFAFIALVLLVAGAGYFYTYGSYTSAGALTEPQARTIAERSCVKGGEALGPGSYDAATKTWWYEANLNATRPGCTSGCVVSETTQAAEVSWRCEEVAGTTSGAVKGKLPGHTYEWSFKSLPEDAQGIPQTAVMLSVDGAAREVGTYEGSCMVIEGSSWKLLDGEHAGAICYFAGGGTEIGVFEENNTMVVKQGFVDEGSAEVAGTRGGFKTLFTI